ncbi:hypothetical protein SAMN05216559_2280 [Halomicrobium zhouii]|uniref:Halobacterial output domain-containing protein n=1 Tax=Halomicrobium zhouii TaxID=767519 RepID=A0A1I6L8T0_9EURY|nr:HalOD1 output domain-containing protein [Halomicrobium zhouii]SFR99913.1 hypothetical protein SAMN05216559_2280 [Halomicrobium zhouii]
MVDLAKHDSSQSGVDARIGARESVVQSVLEAVHPSTGEDLIGSDSTQAGTSTVTTPPLYDFVNPDALEALYSHAQDHRGTAEWTTTFRYADADVSVTSAGTVTVEPRDGGESDQRGHACPGCEDATVGVSDDRFVVGATLQCPECGHEWAVSF